MKKIAVVLSGCGNKDGSEIHESVSALISIASCGVEYDCFAPSIDYCPIHFITNEIQSEKRNTLTESARIARGKIQELTFLNSSDYAGLVIPGGFGAATHLSNWAQKGAACTVYPKLQSLLEEFYAQKKPIAAICIAPTLVARVLGSNKITLTIGNDKETAAEIEKTGAIHEVRSTTDYVADKTHQIYTTPAYMNGQSTPAEVFTGISLMINNMLQK